MPKDAITRNGLDADMTLVRMYNLTRTLLDFGEKVHLLRVLTAVQVEASGSQLEKNPSRLKASAQHSLYSVNRELIESAFSKALIDELREVEGPEEVKKCCKRDKSKSAKYEWMRLDFRMKGLFTPLNNKKLQRVRFLPWFAR